ncbi:fumarate hydratase [Euryarchaeota archaeon ex4484_162]|nr:MAG: fumarate hydratase [Euryarchaeota archaeon ex4484_162]RLF26589.1 MAG: fumarate hydratase [Thermoplasmata archaeon]RLF36685.1 MAG: fumarate hydratase [Thermoplasmata archaeon]
MNDKDVVDGIVELIRKAEISLPDDVVTALRRACENEEKIARIQLETILNNVEIAEKTKRPMCQDTGIQTFFVKIGLDFPYVSRLRSWIIDGVRKATEEIPIRPNTVDPFTGKNHGDNTGDHIPYITWDFVEGENVWITALPKGGGSENMSRLGMLKPGVGIQGVKDFVIDTVIKAGGNPCPPTIVGVGIGGGADLAMKLAKTSLLRPVGIRHSDRNIAKLEMELIDRINRSGIGPMGLGGKTTVLDVHVEKAHRHPASLPVGVVIQCWANRRAEMIIYPNGKWEVK